MPSDGVSSEWLGGREDEIADFLTARDHLDGLRRLTALLRERRLINESYYHDTRDSIEFIEGALLKGKRNTAKLRNLGGH